MSGTDQIAFDLASHLGPSLEPCGFKYVKSLRSFRRVSADVQSLIGLDVTRAHNGSYILAFNFQVLHKALEEVLATFGPRPNATVFQNSYNVHPNRPISYAGPTFWNRSIPIDWAGLLPEVSEFVVAVVRPWIEKFGDRENLRDSLAADDGWAISLRPWEIVAAVDILGQRKVGLVTYLSEQRAVSGKWVPARAAELSSFIELIYARLPSYFDRSVAEQPYDP